MNNKKEREFINLLIIYHSGASSGARAIYRALVKIGGLKLTLVTHPTAMKFGRSFTDVPTKTMGIGYVKTFSSIAIFPIVSSFLNIGHFTLFPPANTAASISPEISRSHTGAWSAAWFCSEPSETLLR